MNIIAYNTSSTSINVTWLPVPANHMNGIILGYRVLYRRKDKPLAGFDNVTLNSSSFNVEITGLEFFTKYEIRLLGFTIAGDGNMSEPLFCLTDESGNVYIFCFSQYIRNGNSLLRLVSSLCDMNNLYRLKVYCQRIWAINSV